MQLTKLLVQHPSIVGTIGERDMAYQIYEILQQFPYFKEHPHDLKLLPTRQDEHERYNVLALVKGANPMNNETVILMGHMDTVGVEDYGKWKRYAFFPDELVDLWKKSRIPASVRADIASGNWLGGRGIVDMKSGVASHLAILRYFSDHRDELDGNLLLAITCDEENNSRGILSALADIDQFAREENLQFIAAINSDYTAPRYDDDPHRYVYLGTVGKLLPAFFVVGKETHVGQAFEGFDPNLLVSELTSRLDYNTDLCDEMFGEVTLPPVSLKQTDLKPHYDVQTPRTAFVYYNVFVHSWSPQDVLQRLKETATTAFEVAISKFQTRYRCYCELSGHPYQPIEVEPRVYTYDEFYQRCREQFGTEFEQKMLQFSMNVLNEENLDLRNYSRRLVEELWEWGGDSEPAIILFYASSYIPRVVLSEADHRDNRLIEAVNQGVNEIQPNCEQPIQVRKFFPYISDMSFVAISDDEKDMQAFEKNMPAWGMKQQMDMEAIRKLDVPVINIGPYGKGAHKQWERVEITYSMEIVPNLTVSVIRHLFRS
ncbi:M20/M25/M40 family metallo-hydrolase [Paenactinomyces guangxiensis]|uniref:M20/M25/M40 family metallo-hydrolase n=2 Tax=Paenactinomyces guangxiensis TaxID=1490290 RepID=A0A7W1WNP0_9BACL|nr:M20/M25/M40 family metallo-hydrolase [Paenactinomyces guangxiensis]MBH8589911.1 M20/M25/M40 family metallo-hydrolase [Paenactinomyces guangxiensis]